MTGGLSVRGVPVRSRRVATVTWAFVRMGARATFSYPLSFLLLQLGTVAQVVAFVFLERLIRHSPSLGSGYLAFAAVGLAAAQVISGGVLGLGQELDWTIQQGRLEMLLIEPVSWRLIPLALATWPTLYRGVTGLVTLVVAGALGAAFTFGQVPADVALLLLAAVSGVAIGVLAGSFRVLAKRGDPIATLYTMAAFVLSGQFVPINLFPPPLRALAWLFPNTYVIAGLRKALMPSAAHVYGPDPAQAILALLIMCAVLLPLGLWLFGRSLEVGRRYGVLAGY